MAKRRRRDLLNIHRDQRLPSFFDPDNYNPSPLSPILYQAGMSLEANWVAFFEEVLKEKFSSAFCLLLPPSATKNQQITYIKERWPPNPLPPVSQLATFLILGHLDTPSLNEPYESVFVGHFGLKCTQRQSIAALGKEVFGGSESHCVERILTRINEALLHSTSQDHFVTLAQRFSRKDRCTWERVLPGQGTGLMVLPAITLETTVAELLDGITGIGRLMVFFDEERILRVKDVCHRDREQLRRGQGIGEKMINVIESRLWPHDLRLGMSPQELVAWQTNQRLLSA